MVNQALIAKLRESSRIPSFVFIYDNMNIVTVIDSFLKGEELLGTNPPVPKMHLTQNRPKAIEMLKKTKTDFLIVDHTCIGSADGRDWVTTFRQELTGGLTAPESFKIFLLGNPTLTNDEMEGLLRAGFDDIFFKPLDMPIVAQKINNTTSVVFSKQNQLYFAPITSIVKLAYRYQLEGLSEAGARLLLDQALKEGEVFTMIIPEFEQFGIREIVAKVIDCKPHATQKEKFTANINFVGIQPNVTKTIRRWMVEEYIKTK